jgi:colicin import membrane protein
MRAVKMCTPFTLPPDSYAAWKTIIWDFDPRQML